MDLGRNLETIRKQGGHWAGETLSPAEEHAVRVKLMGWLPPTRLRYVTELGIGASAIPAIPKLLAEGAAYAGYDRREAKLENARARVEGRAEILALPEGAEIPAPSASQDLFLSLFTLERLRMDELYMAIAEMRRLVKPGSYAALAAIHPGDTFFERIAASFFKAAGRGAPLQLSHYLSPEDWEPVREENLRLKQHRVAGLMLLRRLPEEAV